LKFHFLKFAGGGGFSGTPTHAGTYAGSDDYDNYYMIIAYTSPPCEDFNDNSAQVIQFRGNAGGGNEDEDRVYINYQEDENHQIPVYPSISVLR